VWVCVRVCVRTCVCVHVHVCVVLCVCVYVLASNALPVQPVQMCVRLCVCVCVRERELCVCMCVCVCGWVSNDTHVSCLTCEWVMQKSSVVNEDTNDSVTEHIRVSQVTNINESCHIFKWVI